MHSRTSVRSSLDARGKDDPSSGRLSSKAGSPMARISLFWMYACCVGGVIGLRIGVRTGRRGMRR